MIVIRKAVPSDIVALKDRLREADREEIIAAGNSSVQEALEQSFNRSEICLCVEQDSVVSALFGVVPDTLLGASANVWFLGSPEMRKIKKSFVKYSRFFIKEWLNRWPTLWNVVDGRYCDSLKWLMSCGAKFTKQPLVLNGVDFYLFRIEA